MILYEINNIDMNISYDNQFTYIDIKIYFIILINTMSYIFQFIIYIKEPPSDIRISKY